MTGKVLVTGGFGYIGSHLAVRLIQMGYHVILGSRKPLVPPAWLPQAEVAQIVWNDKTSLELMCKGVDIIIQAAGMNAQDSVADPVAALKFNGLATARLVAAASQSGVKRIIYLSTAHVYINPLVGTITEETCPLNLHPYATSHLAGERAILAATLRGEIEGIVLRLSNAFGTPMHKDTNCWMLLVNNLCRQAVQNKELILKSNGLQQRDFIPIRDVVDIINLIIEKYKNSDSGEIYNLGRGESTSVLGIAKLVAERYKKQSGILPKIKINKAGFNLDMGKLDYRVDKILSAGYIKSRSKIESNIDEILDFCRIQFSN